MTVKSFQFADVQFKFIPVRPLSHQNAKSYHQHSEVRVEDKAGFHGSYWLKAALNLSDCSDIWAKLHQFLLLYLILVISHEISSIMEKRCPLPEELHIQMFSRSAQCWGFLWGHVKSHTFPVFTYMFKIIIKSSQMSLLSAREEPKISTPQRALGSRILETGKRHDLIKISEIIFLGPSQIK